MKIFISEDIQWPMDQQGITPTKLALAIRWSPTNIYPVLSGKRSITRQTAELIADALGVEPDSIIEYDVDPDETPRLKGKKEAIQDKIRWNERKLEDAKLKYEHTLEDAKLKYERIAREHSRLSRKYEAELAEIVEQLVFLRADQK